MKHQVPGRFDETFQQALRTLSHDPVRGRPAHDPAVQRELSGAGIGNVAVNPGETRLEHHHPDTDAEHRLSSELHWQLPDAP